MFVIKLSTLLFKPKHNKFTKNICYMMKLELLDQLVELWDYSSASLSEVSSLTFLKESGMSLSMMLEADLLDYTYGFRLKI